MYTFQSESTLYSCLNVKDIWVKDNWRHNIWSLTDRSRIQTYNHLNHLVRKRTLNHLAKLASLRYFENIKTVVSSRTRTVKNKVICSIHLVSLAKWLSAHSRTKWLWVLNPIAVKNLFFFVNCAIQSPFSCLLWAYMY